MSDEQFTENAFSQTALENEVADGQKDSLDSVEKILESKETNERINKDSLGSIEQLETISVTPEPKPEVNKPSKSPVPSPSISTEAKDVVGEMHSIVGSSKKATESNIQRNQALKTASQKSLPKLISTKMSNLFQPKVEQRNVQELKKDISLVK